MLQPGFEGAQLHQADVRLSLNRTEARVIRCRPGTFEWRYGRESADASLYHAGVHYANLWERAGTAAASSPDLMSEGHGAWKGLPDGRAFAMQKLNQAFLGLGRLRTSNLTDYCVRGLSVSEIAGKYEAKVRDMSAVLHHDLIACARHFNYLSTR